MKNNYKYVQKFLNELADVSLSGKIGLEELEICRSVGSFLACKINDKEVKCAA